MKVAVTVVLDLEVSSEEWAKKHTELVLARLLDDIVVDYTVVETCEHG